jgi:hypothetical protein
MKESAGKMPAGDYPAEPYRDEEEGLPEENEQADERLPQEPQPSHP